MRAPAFAVCLCLLLVTAASHAQDDDDDEDNPFRPGVVATYKQQRGGLTRVETAPSLDWRAVPADIRLEPGNVEITWQGRLLTQGADEYRLYVYAAGDVKVDLAGKTVINGWSDAPQWFSSDVLKLEHDYHPLLVKYIGTGDEKRLRLFWSSALFALEPIPARQLYHETAETAKAHDLFAHGQQVARGLRCAACHDIPGESEPLASPALDKLSGNMQRPWLTHWLRTEHVNASKITETAAADLAAYLLKDDAEPQVDTPAQEAVSKGRRIFETVGCLACHRVGEQGTTGLLSGGDLSRVAEKRPAAFFARWLASPSEWNRDHRMPVYELSAGERGELSAYLSTLKGAAPAKEPRPSAEGNATRGKQLFARLECHSCHRNVAGQAAERAVRLKTPTTGECAQVSVVRPVAAADVAALATFLASSSKLPVTKQRPLDAPRLLAEKNCLNCHAREGAEGLAPKLLALAKADAELAPLVPALTPPSLLAVGDKLNDTVLLAMMKRMEQPHRDYLQVRMPTYSFTQEELETLLAYFIAYDRIPPKPPDDRARPPENLPPEKELAEAGQKLVIAGSGFGCTSCHAIGKHLPSKAPINARGPNISNVAFRIRAPYFYRWCKNPARIVPGQEMPAVSVPVKKVLNENLDHQLAAIWTILNTPGFEPKDAGPVRIVRYSGVFQPKGPAEFSLDMVRSDGQLYTQPWVISLPNRHNLLYDFRHGRLDRWWTGDTMAQFTEGKSWYWQTLGEDVLRAEADGPEIELVRTGENPAPLRDGSSIVRLNRIYYSNPGLWMSYTLRFRDVVPDRRDVSIDVSQTFTTPQEEDAWRNRWLRTVRIYNVPEGAQAQLRVVSSKRMEGARTRDDNRTLLLAGEPGITLRIVQEKDDLRKLAFAPDGTVLVSQVPRTNGSTITIAYETNQPPALEGDDRTFRGDLQGPRESPKTALLFGRPATVARQAPLAVVPGLKAERLPLDERMMPTAMTWAVAAQGETPDIYAPAPMFVASLEGRVWKVHSDDRIAKPFSPVLPTPYGLVARGESGGYVDVVTKSGLLRLHGSDRSYPEVVSNLASGWGFTDDYHDWAVGLVEQDGRYIIALPCQQDKRGEADATYRGNVLSVTGIDKEYLGSNLEDPATSIAPVSQGHRFPMGIARNRAGDVFVTDNQGNYNPFNELNHVQKGKHFGFINAIDKNKPKPPTTPPAINIPHPWTRSVNGICFLETPEKLRLRPTFHSGDPFSPAPAKPAPKSKALWGAFEGHLIGCEYDTRRLIRMSLQKVGDTYQGACYPFSLEKPTGENFLGPISCAISPRGELYIGSIRDSGWGGGANIGEIVRIDPPGDAMLPPGIAEVRATKKGFTIRFTQPVDAALASDAKNYSIESFTRESTPAYGGPDKERRAEKVASIQVANDGLSATVELLAMRTGYVYEFHLRPLHAGDFFPAEAYYTLNFLPE